MTSKSVSEKSMVSGNTSQSFLEVDKIQKSGLCAGSIILIESV